MVSEHLLNSDKPSDFEVHLLHLPKGSESFAEPKVVIGILYRHDSQQPSNKGMGRLNEQLIQRKSDQSSYAESVGFADASQEISIPLLDLFPKTGAGEIDLQNWFHYQGSLTSEPYSEDVSWFVMKNESSIDKSTLGHVEEKAEQHARPVYALDRRFILRSFD